MPTRENKVNTCTGLNSGSANKVQVCFLCQAPASEQCSQCKLVYYCSKAHYNLHRVTIQEDDSSSKEICLPYKTENRPGIGRVLIATRTIKPMELVLIDPGTVTGPNYTSRPVCLECLRPVNGNYLCPGCEYPMCDNLCSTGPNHLKECEIISKCKPANQPPTLQIDRENYEKVTNAYAIITPLRMLLLEESNGDQWKRSNQLMDHQEERVENIEEWSWYEKYIVNYYLHDLKLAGRFTPAQIHHAIGLINVNSVALKFPMNAASKAPEGKGLYPIFAIGSHYCICNARYTLDPQTRIMYVRARCLIPMGMEISVQYLSALYGNFKRRKKIKDEWYFDCVCRRCSDPTERGSFISAVRCTNSNCVDGYLLPQNSLDSNSTWTCQYLEPLKQGCGIEMSSEDISKLVEEIEEHLEGINSSGNFNEYLEFVQLYSQTLLHKNHYLIMTAARNLIQWYTYRSAQINDQELRNKLDLCRQLDQVLGKIDPGYSEIRSFVQKELHFSNLVINQRDMQAGLMDTETYLEKSRTSMKVLDELDRYKNSIKFNCVWNSSVAD